MPGLALSPCGVSVCSVLIQRRSNRCIGFSPDTTVHVHVSATGTVLMSSAWLCLGSIIPGQG